MREKLARWGHWVLFEKHENSEPSSIDGFSPITLIALDSYNGEIVGAEDMVLVCALRHYRDTTDFIPEPSEIYSIADRKPVFSQKDLTFISDDGTLYYAKRIGECDEEELRSILLELSDTMDPFTVNVAKRLVNKDVKDLSIFGKDFEDGFNFCKEKYAETGLIPVDDAIQVVAEHIHTTLEPKSEHSMESLRLKLLKKGSHEH